jgi:hypothetical protein
LQERRHFKAAQRRWELEKTPGTPQYAVRQAQLQAEAERAEARKREAAARQAPLEAHGITTWVQAERAMAAAMTRMGFENVRVTKRGADEGIDIKATRALAQGEILEERQGWSAGSSAVAGRRWTAG